jgi:oxygen-independent coproporphyrinogen-3 oxidase
MSLTHEPAFGVYLHWPFCLSKCPYCDFNSHVRHGGIDEARYVRAFAREIAATAERVPGRVVSTIFFGGGTPSLMQPSTVEALVNEISKHWIILPGAEVTLEANPGTVEAARFRGFRDAGVNRISLGVQSFDERMLAALGRIHGADEARRAIAAARESFDNFNVDLMYGLPGQTLAMARADIEEAARSGAPHVSAYQLTIEPNTVFFSNPPKLPVHDAFSDMQITVEEKLGVMGYRRY